MKIGDVYFKRDRFVISDVDSSTVEMSLQDALELRTWLYVHHNELLQRLRVSNPYPGMLTDPDRRESEQ